MMRFGVTTHANTAVLVTLTSGGELLDRRRLVLTSPGLPTHPHHREGSWAVGRYLNSPGARAITLPEAVALVERVRAAADRGAREALQALAAEVPVPVVTIAIPRCPPLPPSIEGRIADHRAQTMADSVMYRQALADAADARGWIVRWYGPDRVSGEAVSAFGRWDLAAALQTMGRAAGPPWRAAEKMAATAALAAAAMPGRRTDRRGDRRRR